MRDLGSRSETSRDESDSPIRAVERAARVLAMFSIARPMLSVAEITARLGVSKATGHRYAVALRNAQLLRWDTNTNLYALGPRAVSLGAAALAASPTIKAVGPFLERLATRVNETAVFSIWDGEAPIVARVYDQTARVIRVSVPVGTRLDQATSAQGRVFLASIAESEWPTMRLTARDRQALDAALDEVRSTGVAVHINDEEGIAAVAAALFQQGEIVGSLAIVGTSASVEARTDSAVADELRAAAKAFDGGEADWR